MVHYLHTYQIDQIMWSAFKHVDLEIRTCDKLFSYKTFKYDPLSNAHPLAAHCLKIAQNVAFEFLAFSTILLLLAVDGAFGSYSEASGGRLASLVMLNDTFSVIFKHRARY